MSTPDAPENELTADEGAPGTPGTAPVTPAGDEKALPADIAELSYEAARDQLVEVVRRLESGQGGLEDSIALWERGEALANRCEQWLDGARDRLDAARARRESAEDQD